jgi:hypothetical protein
LALFNDYWSPKIIGDLNDSHVKLAKFKGEFVWHKHVILIEPKTTLNTGDARSER